MILNLFDMDIKEKKKFNQDLSFEIFDMDIEENKYHISKGVHK